MHNNTWGNGAYTYEIGEKNEIIMHSAWGLSYLAEFDKYKQQLVNRLDKFGIIKQFAEYECLQLQQVKWGIDRLIRNVWPGCGEHTNNYMAQFFVGF